MDAGPSCSPNIQVAASFDSNIRNQFDDPPGPLLSVFSYTNLIKSADRIESKIGRLSPLDDGDNPNVLC